MTGRYRTDDGSNLITRIVSLDERISRLERNPSAISAAIDRGNLIVREGSIQILDATGAVVIEMGKLSDGSYDLASIDPSTGNTIRLFQLTFGIKEIYDTTVSHRNAGTYADPDTGSTGPTLTGVVVGSSGRVKVTVTASMTGQYNSPQTQTGGAMSYDISGPTNRSASDEWGVGGQFQLQPAVAGPVVWGMKASVTYIHKTLTPGTYTFTSKYKAIGTAGCDFVDRALVVEPF